MTRNRIQPESTRTKSFVSHALPQLQPYQRCKCGSCEECIENDRWDRIFAKFDVTRRSMASAAVRRPFEAAPHKPAGAVSPSCEMQDRSPLPEGWAGVWARMSDERLEAAARDYFWLSENSQEAGTRRWLEIVAEFERRRKPMPSEFSSHAGRAVASGIQSVLQTGDPYL